MIGLLQRVSDARVEVAGVTISAIGNGLLVFVGVERGDNETIADRLLDRLLGYRVFADSDGKMNWNLRDVGGELLLVPQFTLAADTTQGSRASFSPAAPAEEGQRLFEYLFHRAEVELQSVASGLFGADMQVKLTNNGPVTFWLQVPPSGTRREASTRIGSLPG
jgi:D-tyrosyl-tRNA(Tyr) deacylase